MYRIGIVGRGFVGSAVEFGFSDKTEYVLFINDKDESKSVNEMRTVTKSRKLTKLSSRVKRTSVAKAPQAKVYR